MSRVAPNYHFESNWTAEAPSSSSAPFKLNILNPYQYYKISLVSRTFRSLVPIAQPKLAFVHKSSTVVVQTILALLQKIIFPSCQKKDQ